METAPGTLGSLIWILSSGAVMTMIALVGSVTLLMREETLQRIILPLVAFAAGSLLGGAFFHMLPASLIEGARTMAVFVWTAAGFCMFFLLEQFLHYHHCHRASAECKKPLSYLILVGDGLHNLLGGIAVATTFMVDIRLGIATWLAAAAHEVPQELGDFAVLLHGGWTKKSALLYNALSGATFLIGGVLAYVLSSRLNIGFLVPFAAGNFIYIGASDLVPEVNRHRDARTNVLLFVSFIAGLLLLLAIRLLLEE